MEEEHSRQTEQHIKRPWCRGKKQIKAFLGKLGETQFIAQLHMKTNDIKWGRGGGMQGLDHAASNGNAELGFYSMPNGKPQEYFKPDAK